MNSSTEDCNHWWTHLLKITTINELIYFRYQSYRWTHLQSSMNSSTKDSNHWWIIYWIQQYYCTCLLKITAIDNSSTEESTHPWTRLLKIATIDELICWRQQSSMNSSNKDSNHWWIIYWIQHYYWTCLLKITDIDNSSTEESNNRWTRLLKIAIIDELINWR